MGFKKIPMSFCHRQGCGAQDAVGSNSCCWIQHWRTGSWAPVLHTQQGGLGPSRRLLQRHLRSQCPFICLEGSWRVVWLTSRTSVRWSLELILHSLVVLNSDAARDIPRISFGNVQSSAFACLALSNGNLSLLDKARGGWVGLYFFCSKDFV